MKIQNGISLQPPPKEQADAERDSRLREAAKMYETHFLNEMVKSMRKTVDNDNGLIKRNMAEKIFAEQLDGQYVDAWAGKGGVGIADMIYGQIREKYMGALKRDFMPAQKHLPVAPKKEPFGLQPGADAVKVKALPPPSAGARLEYRFEVPDAGGEHEAQVPIDGVVVERARLGENWNLVKLDHGRGFTSELTFPGRMAPFDTGLDLRAGQKLGTLDSGRPVLAWKLEWLDV